MWRALPGRGGGPRRRGNRVHANVTARATLARTRVRAFRYDERAKGRKISARTGTRSWPWGSGRDASSGRQRWAGAHGLGAARYAGACATTRAACSDNFRESKAASAAWSPSAASGMGGQNDAGRPALLRRSQHCHHPLGPAGGGNAGCTHTRAA